jgi:putative membrane protein
MGNGWGMGWMWFIGPLILAGIVLLVVVLLRGNVTGGPGGGGELRPPGRPRGERSRAQEILDERYARGEITDEEYRDRLRHLRGETDG